MTDYVALPLVFGTGIVNFTASPPRRRRASATTTSTASARSPTCSRR
jgi:hypothetical protein